MSAPLRLLSYNIRYGGLGREGLLSTAIRTAAPDVVVLQEATHPAVVEQLARDTGLGHWGCRRGDSPGMAGGFPVRAEGCHQAIGAKADGARVRGRTQADRGGCETARDIGAPSRGRRAGH